MKKRFTYIIACVIVAFLLFAIMYWVIRMKFGEAMGIAVSGILGGFAGELLDKFQKRKKLNRVTERISE